MRSVPPAAAVLRRALLAWGLGHLHLGDRRGWLLLIAQGLALGGLLLLGSVLIEGSRWIVLFPLLLVIVMAWMAQAIHAHQRAIELGAAPGGELQVAWLLPLIVAAVTAFWLLGGQNASPSAALQQYVAAWRADRPAAAGRLFRSTVAAETLASAWKRHDQHLRDRVAAAATTFGPFSGLDAADPFNTLRFIEVEDRRTVDRAVFAIEVTRRERIEATLFGFLPTATQQTVVVERVGLVSVAAREAPPPAWLPLELLRSRLWVVEEVQLPLGTPVREGSVPGSPRADVDNGIVMF